MGACDGCGRILLVLINIIFACIGILMLVIGCIVRYGKDAMSDILDDWYRRFKEALEEAGIVDSNLEDFKIEEFLDDVAIIFIVVGVFFFVLGVIGCIGACLKNRVCLIIYTIIVVVIILLELTCVILLFAIKDEIKDWLKDPLHDAIKDDYTGINGTDGVTLGLNFIMSEFDCCGVDNYTEFLNATKWDRSLPNGQLKMIPVICCKNKTQAGLDSSQCLSNPTTENAYIDKGCYDAIEDWVIDNQDILIGSSSGVAAVEIILVICACVVCVKKRKHKGYEKHV